MENTKEKMYTHWFRILLIALIVTCYVGSTIHKELIKDQIITKIENNHNTHNKVHELYKEAVQLNNYFQNQNCGDYYNPQTVIVDCPLIKHQYD